MCCTLCCSSLSLGPHRPISCYPCFVFVGLFSFATHLSLSSFVSHVTTLSLYPSLLLSINAPCRRKSGVLVFESFILVTTAPSEERGDSIRSYLFKVATATIINPIPLLLPNCELPLNDFQSSSSFALTKRFCIRYSLNAISAGGVNSGPSVIRAGALPGDRYIRR
jgi:hypothetical protein